MRSVKNRLACAVPLFAMAGIFSGTAFAGEFISSKNIVCAVVKVVACVEDIGCQKGTAKAYDLPDLIIYDAEKKGIRAAHEHGIEEMSPVKNFEVSGNHVILQGVENSRGWDIAINSKTGKMSGAVVGDGVGLLVSGSCTAI
jgi:hypothetical protein